MNILVKQPVSFGESEMSAHLRVGRLDSESGLEGVNKIECLRRTHQLNRQHGFYIADDFEQLGRRDGTH